jgi:NNP family nitrate/nitrite transporter-like MFS transporter
MQSRDRWILLAHTVLVNFMFGGVSWYYVVMVAAGVQADLGIGIREWGLLWSGTSLGVLLASIPGGAAGDRYGVRGTIAASLVVSGVALLLRAAAGQFLVMLLAMILFGVGLGVASANVPKALGTWFPPEKLGLANGLALAGVGAGQACAALFTVPVSTRLGGWRSLTLLLGAVLLCVGFYWWLAVRGPASPASSAAPAPRLGPSMVQVLRVRAVWWLALCYALFLGGLLGVIGYLPTYLMAIRGLNETFAAFVISLAPWTFVVGSALLPALSDRVGLRGTVYCTGILSCAVLVMGHAYFGGFALALTGALLGLMAGAVGILFVVPIELHQVGARLAGTALGLIVSAGFLGGSLFPALGMSLAETRPVAALGFFAAAFALSAAVFLLIRGSRQRHSA